jgi:HEAT repeat protein
VFFPRRFPLLALTVASLPLAIPRAALAWEAASDASGAVEIRDSGKLVASLSPKTPKEGHGQPTIRHVSVADHSVLEVRLPILGEGPKREEVWVAELPSKNVIWWDQAGAHDVDGETSQQVVVTEKAIEEFQTAGRLYRCDGVPAQLFRRTWDFATRQFKPQPPALPATAPSTIKARRGDAQMPTGKPLGGFHFHAASSSAGAAGDVRRLSAPTAINDDDPATVWTADTHQGRGEFFTARSSAGFAITGLRILPGDTSSAKVFTAAARPRRLTLFFGRGPEQSLDVDLVEDADGGAKRFRQPFWIPLPKPVASGCLTVMIREVTTGRAATAVADLAVMTEIDGSQAVDRLVADLASGTSCETRRPLLASIGGAALDKVTAALAASPPGQGRACLVETLVTLMPSPLPTDSQPIAAPPALASALAAALIAATPDEEKIVIALLARLPEPPVSAIAGLLADEKRGEPDRLRAARALALLAQPEARLALLAALGKGSSSLRTGLRETAAGAKPPLARAALDALAKVPGSAQGQRADLLFVLSAAATREPEQLPATVEILRATLQNATSFEEQARAIQGLGMIRDADAIAELAAFRNRAADSVLRFFATRELAGIADPEAGKALRGALLDSDPRAREAAVLSLGQRHDQEMATQIIEAAKQEPWPSVRRAQVMALGDLCVPDGNNLLLRAYEKDVDDIRMAALVGLAHCRDRRASALLVRVLGRLPESADMRSLAARLLADMKDPRTTAPMAAALKRLQKESQSDLSLEGTITETVMALAAIAGKDSVAAAADLLTDSRPSLQKAAVQALGRLCDPGAGAAALRTAAQSKDESVSVAATMATEHCRSRLTNGNPERVPIPSRDGPPPATRARDARGGRGGLSVPKSPQGEPAGSPRE